MFSKGSSKVGLFILIVVLCYTFQQCGINAQPVKIKYEKTTKLSVSFLDYYFILEVIFTED